MKRLLILSCFLYAQFLGAESLQMTVLQALPTTITKGNVATAKYLMTNVDAVPVKYQIDQIGALGIIVSADTTCPFVAGDAIQQLEAYQSCEYVLRLDTGKLPLGTYNYQVLHIESWNNLAINFTTTIVA